MFRHNIQELKKKGAKMKSGLLCMMGVCIVIVLIAACSKNVARDGMQQQPEMKQSNGAAIEDPEVQKIDADINNLNPDESTEMENIDSDLENLNW